MNVDQTGEFRSALIELKARLSGPESRRNAALQRRVTLPQLEAALQRLDQGTYGICRRCFLVIPRGELLKQPYAEVCARCQARQVAQDRLLGAHAPSEARGAGSEASARIRRTGR